MKKTFHQYFPLSESQINEIWENGLIVLDTNVLLNIYRYTEDTKSQFLSIISNEKFKERLWIPYQVAYEFHKNRVNVILDQQKPLEKILSIVEKNFNNLLGEVKDCKLHKFHPFLNKDGIVELINNEKIELKSKINGKADGNPDLTKNDHLLESIHNIFSGVLYQNYVQIK